MALVGMKRTSNVAITEIVVTTSSVLYFVLAPVTTIRRSQTNWSAAIVRIKVRFRRNWAAAVWMVIRGFLRNNWSWDVFIFRSNNLYLYEFKMWLTDVLDCEEFMRVGTIHLNWTP